MNIAAILAGGMGSRMQSDVPKQFLKVAGKMVIEHTIKAFQDHPLINEICVVSRIDYRSQIESIINSNRFNKVKKVIPGGANRSNSSQAAINAYNGDINFIIHDAVRPLVTERIITEIVDSLGQYNVVNTAIPIVDTVIQVENNLIRHIHDRSVLMRAQTPQGFKHETIKRAYELMASGPSFKATDDCSVVRQYLPDEKIFVVSGDSCNIKLTSSADLLKLDRLLEIKTEYGDT